MPPSSLTKYSFSRLEAVGAVSIGCALTFGVLLGAGGHGVLALIAGVIFFGLGITLFTRAPSSVARSAAFSKVELRTDPFKPGAEVRVQVVLEPRSAVTIRSGRLVMRCVERAWIQQGNRHVERLETAAEIDWPMELPRQIDRPYTHPMRVKALDQVSPGAEGVLWTELAVELDLERWPKIIERVRVPVLAPDVPREAEPAPSLLDTEVELWGEVVRKQYRRGETVRGVIKICAMEKARHARALTVSLTWVAHGPGDHRSKKVAELELATGPFLEDTTLAFSLALPLDAPLTYRGQMIDIDWYVEALLLDTPGLSPRSHTGFVVG